DGRQQRTREGHGHHPRPARRGRRAGGQEPRGTGERRGGCLEDRPPGAGPPRGPGRAPLPRTRV
ncbi:MAG: hypothetical protein AVDCRST_MAG55-530, partial [uncultured Rubrobacteraceae bacterium]